MAKGLKRGMAKVGVNGGGAATDLLLGACGC